MRGCAHGCLRRWLGRLIGEHRRVRSRCSAPAHPSAPIPVQGPPVGSSVRVPLGEGGPTVFPLILGGAEFGWNVDLESSHDILDAYVELGRQRVHTADSYSRRPQRAHHRPVALVARPARRGRARRARRRAPRQPRSRSRQPRARRRGIPHAPRAPTASTCCTSTRPQTASTALEDTLATAEWLVESGKARALGRDRLHRRAARRGADLRVGRATRASRCSTSPSTSCAATSSTPTCGSSPARRAWRSPRRTRSSTASSPAATARASRGSLSVRGAQLAASLNRRGTPHAARARRRRRRARGAGRRGRRRVAARAEARHRADRQRVRARSTSKSSCRASACVSAARSSPTSPAPRSEPRPRTPPAVSHRDVGWRSARQGTRPPTKRAVVTHYIYLVRHGEHQDAEHGLVDGPLSPRGRRQARCSPTGSRASRSTPCGTRRSSAPARRRAPSPSGCRRVSPRAVRAAVRLRADRHDARDARGLRAVLRLASPRPRSKRAARRWRMPSSEFLVRKRGDVHELLITHNFVIALVRARGAAGARVALDDAQPGALRADRPRAEAGPARGRCVSHNDLAHLPVELRTGLPELYPV